MEARLYEAQFSHKPCAALIPAVGQPLLKYEPGLAEGRLQAVGGDLRLKAMHLHEGNCPAHIEGRMDDFIVVLVLLNGVQENAEEAEAEYRKARDEFDNY